MFGSGFSLGFTMSGVTTQVTAFLGNAVIVGLIATAVALVTIPRIIRGVKVALDEFGGEHIELGEGEVMLPGEHVYGMADGSVRRLNSDDWEEE